MRAQASTPHRPVGIAAAMPGCLADEPELEPSAPAHTGRRIRVGADKATATVPQWRDERPLRRRLGGRTPVHAGAQERRPDPAQLRLRQPPARQPPPEADRDVVLLGIMLHDIGWAVVDREAIFTEGFGPIMMSSEVRIAHEREGARLAGEILDSLGEPAALRDEVVEIIAGHDTRPHAPSRNDELVKDSDKLWRYCVAGISVGCDWLDLSPGAYADFIEPQIEGLFLAESRAMGRGDMAHTRAVLRTELLARAPAS
jgi:hypothetical protein